LGIEDPAEISELALGEARRGANVTQRSALNNITNGNMPERNGL
jgi:hypothetical protein